jgi:hypothetical protein
MADVEAWKVYDPVCKWWVVWAKDAHQTVQLGEYFKAHKAEAVAKKAVRLGVVMAHKRWDEIRMERLLQTCGVFYYPLVEAETGEEFIDGKYRFRCVGRELGVDWWVAACSECHEETRFGLAPPPFGALRPWRPRVKVCDHQEAERKRRIHFFDDYPEYMRADLEARYDP